MNLCKKYIDDKTKYECVFIHKYVYKLKEIQTISENSRIRSEIFNYGKDY